jgi:hypothetical protein
MAGGVKVAEVKDFTRIERIGMVVQQLQGWRWGCGVYSVASSGNLIRFLKHQVHTRTFVDWA